MTFQNVVCENCHGGESRVLVNISRTEQEPAREIRGECRKLLSEGRLGKKPAL